jgi:hypothetical protein
MVTIKKKKKEATPMPTREQFLSDPNRKTFAKDVVITRRDQSKPRGADGKFPITGQEVRVKDAKNLTTKAQAEADRTDPALLSEGRFAETTRGKAEAAANEQAAAARTANVAARTQEALTSQDDQVPKQTSPSTAPTGAQNVLGKMGLQKDTGFEPTLESEGALLATGAAAALTGGAALGLGAGATTAAAQGVSKAATRFKFPKLGAGTALAGIPLAGWIFDQVRSFSNIKGQLSNANKNISNRKDAIKSAVSILNDVEGERTQYNPEEVYANALQQAEELRTVYLPELKRLTATDAKLKIQQSGGKEYEDLMYYLESPFGLERDLKLLARALENPDPNMPALSLSSEEEQNI